MFTMERLTQLALIALSVRTTFPSPFGRFKTLFPIAPLVSFLLNVSLLIKFKSQLWSSHIICITSTAIRVYQHTIENYNWNAEYATKKLCFVLSSFLLFLLSFVHRQHVHKHSLIRLFSKTLCVCVCVCMHWHVFNRIHHTRMSQANPFMITAVGRLHNFDKDQELYADQLAVLRCFCFANALRAGKIGETHYQHLPVLII